MRRTAAPSGFFRGGRMFSADTKRVFVKSIVEIGIFSAAANVLLLVPLYLLQVYDRALLSSNMNTLLYFTARP
jgi:ABC-type protease/lipase transport system fused ATPase/permease subunit